VISKEHENLISRYDDPELNTAEREQLTELLETDDEARELEAQYRRLDAELETLSDGLDGVDFSGFRERIRESIESAPVVRLPHRRLWIRWAPIAAAAASVAIAFLSLWHTFKSDTITMGPTPPKSPVVAAPTSNVKLASIDSAPSETVVNRIQLAAPPVEPSFAVDLESESLYDDGGVICFVGSESDAQEASMPSATGFFGILLKGST